MKDTIRGAGANPDSGMRRSGGSSGDPHGGHDHIDNEWRTPDADPADEMVSAETGDLPAGRKAISSDPVYSGTQRPNLPDSRDNEAYTSHEQPVESAENKLRINQQTKLLEVVPPDASADAQRP